MPWSRKSRAIPLLPLWAVQSVQSLSACTVELYLYSPCRPYGLYRASVPVQYSYTSTPPVGRTVCKEPQCLYKGALFYTFMPSLICKDVFHLIVSLSSRRSSVVYTFFWVIPRRQNFICRHYGTLRLFHLLRQVSMKNTLTQHQQRRWSDLRQILETPSTQV